MSVDAVMSFWFCTYEHPVLTSIKIISFFAWCCNFSRFFLPLLSSRSNKLIWGSVKLLSFYLYMKNFGRRFVEFLWSYQKFVMLLVCLTFWTMFCSSSSLKSAETMRLIFCVACGVMFGVFVGISFSTSSLTKVWMI